MGNWSVIKSPNPGTVCIYIWASLLWTHNMEFQFNTSTVRIQIPKGRFWKELAAFCSSVHQQKAVTIKLPGCAWSIPYPAFNTQEIFQQLLSGICHAECDVNRVNLVKVSYSYALHLREIFNLPNFTSDYRCKSTWHMHVAASHLWEAFLS